MLAISQYSQVTGRRQLTGDAAWLGVHGNPVALRLHCGSAGRLARAHLQAWLPNLLEQQGQYLKVCGAAHPP